MVELTREYTDLFKSMDENLQRQTSFLDSMFDMQKQNFLFQKEMAMDAKRNAALALEEQQKQFNQQQQTQSTAPQAGVAGGGNEPSSAFTGQLGSMLGAGIGGMGVGALARGLVRKGLPAMLAAPVADMVAGGVERVAEQMGADAETAAAAGDIADTATTTGILASLFKKRFALPAAIAGGVYEYMQQMGGDDGKISTPVGDIDATGAGVAAGAAAGTAALVAQQKALTAVGKGVEAMKERFGTGTGSTPSNAPDAPEPDTPVQSGRKTPTLTTPSTDMPPLSADVDTAKARVSVAELETRAQITEAINNMNDTQRAALQQMANDADLRFASDGTLRNAKGHPVTNDVLREMVDAARQPPVLRAPSPVSAPNISGEAPRLVIPKQDVELRNAAINAADDAATAARASTRAVSKALGPGFAVVEAGLIASEVGDVLQAERDAGGEASLVAVQTEISAALLGGMGDLISMVDNYTNKGINYAFGTDYRTDRDLGGVLRENVRGVGYGAEEFLGLEGIASENLNTGIIETGKVVDAAISNVVGAFDSDAPDPYAGYSQYGAQLAAEYNGMLQQQTQTMQELSSEMQNYLGAGQGPVVVPVPTPSGPSSGGVTSVDNSTTINTLANPAAALGNRAGVP